MLDAWRQQAGCNENMTIRLRYPVIPIGIDPQGFPDIHPHRLVRREQVPTVGKGHDRCRALETEPATRNVIHDGYLRILRLRLHSGGHGCSHGRDNISAAQSAGFDMLTEAPRDHQRSLCDFGAWK